MRSSIQIIVVAVFATALPSLAAPFGPLSGPACLGNGCPIESPPGQALIDASATPTPIATFASITSAIDTFISTASVSEIDTFTSTPSAIDTFISTASASTIDTFTSTAEVLPTATFISTADVSPTLTASATPELIITDTASTA